MMIPYYDELGVQVFHGDALTVLRSLPDCSVQCCVTSPPYWGLRDYGTEPIVVGGDAGCDHDWNSFIRPGQSGGPSDKQDRNQGARFQQQQQQQCNKCSAWRGSIGLEPTPEMYVAHMVEVFREVRRVLREDGTLWLNLGDSYAGYHGNSRVPDAQAPSNKPGYVENMRATTVGIGTLKPKDLCGIPWRVAFALQADGWYLRCDIIWAKPNPMPESVTDRPTKAHEYLFLLSKQERYYYDHEAIKEAAVSGDPRSPTAAYPGKNDYREGPRPVRESVKRGDFNGKTNELEGREAFRAVTDFRNKRTVWEVTTCAYPDAHFATFPPKLIEPCILAGSKTGDTILDPFHGAGTTGMVAQRFGRQYIGIELNEAYIQMSLRRLQQGALPL